MVEKNEDSTIYCWDTECVYHYLRRDNNDKTLFLEGGYCRLKTVAINEKGECASRRRL
jgi:hypothetical protein